MGDAGEEFASLFFGDELEGEVEDDDGGVFDRGFEDVLLDEVDLPIWEFGIGVLATALEHRLRTIDSDELNIVDG